MLKLWFAKSTEPSSEHDAVILRPSGHRTPVTIVRIWFEGCEVDTDEAFLPGEQVELGIARMGWIRSTVTDAANRSIQIKFSEECPV